MLPRLSSFKGFVVVAMLALSACASAMYDSVLIDSLKAPYRVGSGDKLRIIVFGQDNLSNLYTVDATGRISFPLIGNVPLRDMTTRDIEQTIAQRLQQGYIREPKVSVEIDVYRPFYIMGEVTTSGQFAFVNGMTVQTAVAIAGGFTPRANQRQATITRKINGELVTGIVPLTHPVRPGDTIMIAERWF
jgi:polysaccharide export outer membrane protein